MTSGTKEKDVFVKIGQNKKAENNSALKKSLLFILLLYPLPSNYRLN